MLAIQEDEEAGSLQLMVYKLFLQVVSGGFSWQLILSTLTEI